MGEGTREDPWTQGDWVPLGAADELKPAQVGSVEAWDGTPPIRWEGTACGRATVAGSACTFRRFWKPLDLQS